MALLDVQTNPKTTVELTAELMRLALELNQQTDYAVFVRLDGHVHQLELEICQSKTENHRTLLKAAFRLEAFPFEPETEFDLELNERLVNATGYLRRTIASGRLDTSGLALQERAFTLQYPTL